MRPAPCRRCQPAGRRSGRGPTAGRCRPSEHPLRSSGAFLHPPEEQILMAEYANPDVLVSTEWVAEHQNDPAVRIVESNEDRALYTQGHIPGAVEIDWLIDLQNQDIRDYVDRAGFEKICRANGISNDTTVVFYGDQNNWWACYAFWVFKLYGHERCKIMDGGRKKWQLDGRSWSSE